MKKAQTKQTVNEKESEIYDRICGMNLGNIPDVFKFVYNKEQYSFCSEDCLERFKANSEKFAEEPIIKLRDIWKVFDTGGPKIQVLRGVDLNVWAGDFVAIVGASGSGKSTLLNIIGLLDQISGGNRYYNGRDLSSLDSEECALWRSKVFGFVFQQYNLIPWFSAYENVVLPLIFSGNENKARIESIEKRINDVGLNDRMSHRPVELSGGEQQRVALLRALANNPDIILGDEPTGNLDSATGNIILQILIDLKKREGKTLIIVTHDADIAKMADQIIAIKDGQIVRDHKAHAKMYTE